MHVFHAFPEAQSRTEEHRITLKTKDNMKHIQFRRGEFDVSSPQTGESATRPGKHLKTAMRPKMCGT